MAKPVTLVFESRLRTTPALIGASAGITRWATGGGLGWLVGGVVLGAVVPFTLVVILMERQLEERVMPTSAQAAPVSKKMILAGRIITGVPTLFLLFDAVGKFVKPAPVVEGTVKLGYPESVIVPLGIVLLACTVLYVIPRTSVLGAILLTGYLGGAVATHVRVSDPALHPHPLPGLSRGPDLDRTFLTG